MECDICGESGFELMPVLKKHMKSEHEDKPETDERLGLYTCSCMKRNYYFKDDPGRLDNVEYVEGDEFPVKIQCECGKEIEGM